MKSLFIALIAAVSFSAHANNNIAVEVVQSITTKTIIAEEAAMNWAVGDTAAYNIDVASFIKGTLTVSVKALDENNLTLSQIVDLGPMGKQNCEAILDPNTGKAKKMTCDGKDQDTNSGEIKVDDMKQESVTVPAGTFQTTHVTAHTTKDNSKIEQWINPKAIPVLGMAKSIMQSQLGPVNMELTSFKKN